MDNSKIIYCNNLSVMENHVIVQFTQCMAIHNVLYVLRMATFYIRILFCEVIVCMYVCITMHGSWITTYVCIVSGNVVQLLYLLSLQGIRHFLYRGLDEQAKVFVGVSGENSVDWLISDFAICLQSMVVVPIHTSLVSSINLLIVLLE